MTPGGDVGGKRNFQFAQGAERGGGAMRQGELAVGEVGWGIGYCGRLGKIRAFTKQNKSLFWFLFVCFFLKISCPGVFLPDKHDVFLGVYLLNQYLETDCFPSMFPLL